MKQGDCLLIDSRVSHRGIANKSENPCPVLSLVYQRPWYIDNVNYQKQKPFDLAKNDLQLIPENLRELVKRGAVDIQIGSEYTQSTQEDYVTDAPYTWSYFEYQNPLLLSYVARLNGYEMPPIASSFTHCDLGCGNGVSINLLAAAYPHVRFVGIDFNSEHIKNARRCADAANLSNVAFVDASFEDYGNSNPEMFDYIAMHGIYSWVSGDVRTQILRLVDKTLKPGGLVYVCYNSLPGWSELIPLWKLMQDYTAHLKVDSFKKAEIGIGNMARLRDSGARYFRDNPSASYFLNALQARNLNYVALEFCNGSFEPLYFSDVANGFRKIGLGYAGTAKIHRNNPDNIYSAKNLEHLDEASEPTEFESRGSFIRNESFRRDIYIKMGDATRTRLELPGDQNVDEWLQKATERYKRKIIPVLVRFSIAVAVTS